MASKKKSPDTDWLAPGNISQALKTTLVTEQTGQQYGAAGPLLREIIDDARVAAAVRWPRGDVYAKRLSGLVDQIIRTLFDFRKSASTKDAPPFCIVAVGGYGRSDLAPYSDIDLLLLHKPGQEDRVRDDINAILYPLWDSGMKVGHSVHTPESAISFAKDDFTGRTAWLEARYLAGNVKLYEEFQTRFEKLRKKTIQEFVAAKLNEQDLRHKTFFESRFLVEPDVKDGKGGLRDLHTIGWLYRYVYGAPIDETAPRRPVFDDDNYKAYLRAHRILMTIRGALHLQRRSDDNRLSFDIQPDIAEKLSYAERPSMQPAERLMRHYFVTTSEIGQLTRVFCARLEEQNTKRLPRLPASLPKKLLTDGIKGTPNFKLKHGRIDFENRAKARTKPIDWFRLVYAFSRQDRFDVHPDALSLIKKNVRALDKKTREDDDINALFRALILSATSLIKTLRIMGETGLLNRFIPAFGRIAGRIDYGLYRRFTLDEQILQAMEELHTITRGNARDEHPISSQIMENAEDPYPYYLAVMFHEIIWTAKDRDKERAAQLIARITKRMGVSPQAASDIGWASANRTLMIKTIEQRNLVDPKTIEQFCKDIHSPSRLKLLLIVTVCHLKVVDIHSWDGRMRGFLRMLYEVATIRLENGPEALQEELDRREAAARQNIGNALTDWTKTEKNWLLGQLDQTSLHMIQPDFWVRFAPIMRNAIRNGLDAAVSATLKDDGTIEAAVFGTDRDGLLTDCAGVIAGLGLSLLGVQATTTSDNKIIDIFLVQSLDGQALNDPAMARRVHEALLSAVREKPSPPKLSRRLGDRRPIFSVTPSVTLDQTASDECLVVEAVGLDRPGLLFQLTRALTEIGVIVRSAHVATFGERAVDTFYLQDAPGYKITNKRRLQSIERRLYNVLSTGTADEI